MNQEFNESFSYSKMTGSGNDFIMVNNMDKKLSIKDLIPLIPKLCARGVSIGADGFIMLEPSDIANFRWHFHNADGSVGEMCGNGARCAARFAYLEKITSAKKLAFETVAGMVSAEITEAPNVKLLLTAFHGLVMDKKVDLKYYDSYSFVNTGVPHVVIFDSNIEDMDVVTVGGYIRNHGEFSPKGTNVNFARVLSDGAIRVRTFERGVEGETLACGTGSVACAIVAIEKGIATSPVTIKTSGGIDLKVYKEGNNLFLEGEARLLAKGIITPEAFQY